MLPAAVYWTTLNPLLFSFSVDPHASVACCVFFFLPPSSLALSDKLAHCSHPVRILWEPFSNYPPACTNLPITLLGRTEIASENTSVSPYIGIITFSLKHNYRKNSDVHLCILSGSIVTEFVFKALKHTKERQFSRKSHFCLV